MTQTFKVAEKKAEGTTIEMVLRDFLQASTPLLHQARPDEREKSVDLLRSYICYHSHKVFSSSSPPLSVTYDPLAQVGQRGLHEILSPSMIPTLLPGFITFLTFEITPVASQRFVRAIGLTMEELTIWLIREGHIGLEEGEESAYRSSEAARNLPKAMRALKRLHRETLEGREEAETTWSDAGELEHYTIARLAPGLLWLENESGRIGPVKISEKVRIDLQAGWQIHCVVSRTNTAWQITGLGGIFPMPA